MKALVVTADDFGLAGEVNEAIEVAHGQGILTAASLMVNGSAVEDAVKRARRLPSLRVGLHLVLVDGRPALPPGKIPDLVDADGWLRNDLLMMGLSLLLPSSVREQVAAEITAQFEAFKQTGLTLDHVNAHHHFHLHPWVAGPLFDIGPRYGMRAMRVPYEPSRILQRIEPTGELRSDWLVGACARRLHARARQRNVRAPDQVFGLAWSGAMTTSRIEGVIRNLPEGVSEIYVHPATRNDFDGAARDYRYVDELAALTATSVADLVRASGARTGGFHDFIAA